MKWRVLEIGFIGAAIAVVAGLFLPTFGEVSFRGTATTNVSSAKQLATGVRLFAMDHEGRFPVHLSELVPDYIPAEQWNQLLYRPYRRGEDEPFPSPQYEWLYFGAFQDEAHPPTILITSPQTFTQEGKKPHRIVAYADGTATELKEAEFQTELTKTITELSERAAAMKATMPQEVRR